MKFSMSCDCGETNTIEAANKNEAIEKFKAMMSTDNLAKHMKAKHPGQPAISLAECHKMIAKQVVQV